MSTIDVAAPHFLPDMMGADMRLMTESELDAVEGGFFPRSSDRRLFRRIWRREVRAGCDVRS